MEHRELFASLFSKYLENRCSPEEIDNLMNLLQSEKYKAMALEMIEDELGERAAIPQVDSALKERLDMRIQHIFDMPGGHSIRKLHQPSFWKWVAAACILVALSTGLYRYLLKADSPEKSLVAKAAHYAAPLTGYARYISLPDGSAVVLHAGSKLEYPAEFTGESRDVVLSGEAYFDIAHNPAKPFIIHTGKVKTTVLGTAFNIKSDGKQVIVSVTRGKVKVEDESKVVAVLTPDQQVLYNIPEAAVVLQEVNATTIVTDWTKENMIFNGLSFGDIADLLTKRYGIPIEFKNEALKKCKIRASFSGTETIERVSSVLCAIRNGTFEQRVDGTIVFDGKGCE